MTIGSFSGPTSVAVAMMLGAASLARAQAKPDTTDPYRYLEELAGDRATAWVRAENAKTLAILERDPRFDAIHRQALAVSGAQDRIPNVSFLAGELYNFWQDSVHVRGIWRKTSLASYRTKVPTWTTVLDLDSLAQAENANWVWKSVTCLGPAQRRCLISLSDGGEDATTKREFDLTTKTFVPNGFALPRGKQYAEWLTEDTLLVAREWSPGEVTASGYAYIVKKVARGRALADAIEIFRGSKEDVAVGPQTLFDNAGHRISLLTAIRSFFEYDHFVVRPAGLTRLDLPRKAQVTAMVQNQLIVQLSEAWTTGGRTIRAGAIASIDAGAAVKDPPHVAPVVIYEPGPRESINGMAATRRNLVVSVYQNVKGRVFVFGRAANGSWTHRAVPLPDNSSTIVWSANGQSDQVVLNVTGFLTPTTLWLSDASKASAAVLKTMSAKFDASHHETEQFEATSTDGTKIPYFIVHPKNMKLDGSTPTILSAYGGFEISNTPNYPAVLGKLWLERGGVYVVANIRGGGEFGPAWHEAGLKTRRQIIYDDFEAVAKDLIARKITSPRRLGIVGGSNGGLLMGVELTQHPELWNAVDIQVPLLDMLRYEQIAAGASWVGEYGSVSVPEERAFLAKISPLNNLRADVTYPLPFIWTTTKDDRVGPQHARKFAAKMSDLGKPYYFYEVVEGGHGSGANIAERAHTSALEYTYFVRQLIGDTKPVP